MIVNESDRRMLKNEAVFRGFNEAVQHGFDEMNQLAREEGYPDLVHDNDNMLQFFCECSDENCKKRVNLTPSKYAAIHKNRQHFVILPNHEVLKIEKIVEQHEDYTVVEKLLPPPENSTKLESTDVDNT